MRVSITEKSLLCFSVIVFSISSLFKTLPESAPVATEAPVPVDAPTPCPEPVVQSVVEGELKDKPEEPGMRMFLFINLQLVHLMKHSLPTTFQKHCVM